MGGRKGQKFRVGDLKQKVRTLEAIFGEKFMRSGLNPRTIDKWLREPDPAPYLSSLKIYFGVIGMKESDMLKPKEAFSRRVAEIHAERMPSAEVRYTPEEVATIYAGFSERPPETLLFLDHTLKMIQKETVKSDFRYLRGDYHMYHYWKSGDPSDAGKVRRNLVTLHRLDGSQGVMKSRMVVSPMKQLKKEDWWEYEGTVLSIKNKLFWLFECAQGMPPEIVTFTVFRPPFWPDPDRFLLHGIVSALSLEGIPCASNMVLRKLGPQEPDRETLGYFSPDHIKGEAHGAHILRLIANEVDGPAGVLAVPTIGSMQPV